VFLDTQAKPASFTSDNTFVENMHIFRYGTTELEYLRKRDRKLGAVIDETGMIERRVIPDLFNALVASVTSQQISAKAAETVWKRLEEQFGTITPDVIATATEDEIRQCGMSTRKAGYIKGIGNAVVKGDISIDDLQNLADEEVILRLTALNGVGIWTAEMLLIFSMERPDVVSWGDLAIRRGMMRLYGKASIDRAAFERYRNRYSPYGSVASLYLWEISHR
jgi:DNA-3-methyladenine glycosylase II